MPVSASNICYQWLRKTKTPGGKMKFIGLGLILLFSLRSMSVRAASSDLVKDNRILSCTRSIVEQGIGGRDGLIFAAQLLESEIEQGKKLSHCKSFLLTGERTMNIDRDDFSNFLEKLEVKASTKRQLNQFNKPFYECRFKKIEAVIAEGFDLKRGLGAAKCVGSNKRTYIILVDQKTYGLDFIAQAFSQNIFIDKENKFLELDQGAKSYAIGEYLGDVLETDLELDEIGTRALSKGQAASKFKQIGRFKAISIEQV